MKTVLLLLTTLVMFQGSLWSGQYSHLILADDIELLRKWPGPNGQELPFTTFRQFEEFLKTARIIDSERLSVGISGARKVLLKKGDVQMHAVFRDISVDKKRAQMADGTIILNFRDDAIFECAAYELSKILGLRYVPPTVRRTINRSRGTLQVWIEDCVMEKERLEKLGQPPSPRTWMLQLNVMYLFDNLINNFDRHAGNILVTPDWKMILIDHTRSFTLDRKLSWPGRISFCEKDVLARLRELDKEILNQRLGFVGPSRINALLVRRDLLVERIDQLIAERGEEVVLVDLWQ